MNSASARAVYSPNEWPIPTFGRPRFLKASIPVSYTHLTLPTKA